MDFFNYILNETETDYAKGLVLVDTIYTIGDAVTYELAKYDFDIVIKNESYLMPLVIANLIFTQETYFDLYYNGDNLYGVYTADLDDDSLSEILKTSLNSFETPKKMKEHTYNFYCFIIDYFFGLKEERSITNAKDFINKKKFMKTGLIRDDIYYNIFDTIIRLEDFHSFPFSRGFYDNNKRNDGFKDYYNNNIPKSFTKQWNKEDEIVNYSPLNVNI